MDCIDYLTIITASKFYEDTKDLKQSIELEIENDSFTLLYGENNYNGFSGFIFEKPVQFENMGDNCAFSINCFSGAFFKDIKKCESDCLLLDQEYKDFLYKLIKMSNDDGIKGIKDNLLDNNGRARYITEQ